MDEYLMIALLKKYLASAKSGFKNVSLDKRTVNGQEKIYLVMTFTNGMIKEVDFTAFMNVNEVNEYLDNGKYTPTDDTKFSLDNVLSASKIKELVDQLKETKVNKTDLANGRQYKGKVDYKTTSSTGYVSGKTVLPTSGNVIGDYWLVAEDNHYYQWNASSIWDDVGTGDNGYNKVNDIIDSYIEDISSSNVLSEYSFTNQPGIVTSSGALIKSENNANTGNIKLVKGQTIIINAFGWKDAFAMVAKYNGVSTAYTPLVIANENKIKTYRYTATEDITVVCSFDSRYSRRCRIIQSVDTINGRINAITYGFVNDGSSATHNDNLMRTYISNDCNTPIYFPRGLYAFSNSINFPDKCYLELAGSAEFILYNSSVQDYFVTIRNGSTSADYAETSYIRGGTINGNGNAKNIIGLNKCHYTSIDHIKIIGFTSNGIVSNTQVGGADGAARYSDLYIYNSKGVVNTCGIRDNGLDTRGTHIEIIDCTTGIYTICGHWTDLNCWIRNPNICVGSTWAILDGYDIVFTDISVDTYQYGFKAKMPGYGCLINGMHYTRNSSVYSDEVEASNPTCVFNEDYDNMIYRVNGLTFNILPSMFSKVEMPSSSFTNIKSYNNFSNVTNYRNDNNKMQLLTKFLSNTNTGFLTKSSNFDEVKDFGVYPINTYDGNGGNNYPTVNMVGSMFVIDSKATTNRTIFQFCLGSNGKCVARTYIANAWQPWFKINTESIL